MKLLKKRTVWLPTWQGWTMLFLILAGFCIVFFLNVHRFLAVTHRVADAEILVMEAWVPQTVLQATAKEFKEGSYRYLLITDLLEYDSLEDRSTNIRTASVVNRIVTLGVSKERIIECQSSVTDDRRSVAMAVAVRDMLRRVSIKPKGINIMTSAAHARKTLLIYSRTLNAVSPVGIIAVPTGDYDPAKWWMTTAGAKWVISNGIGWLYEVMSGS